VENYQICERRTYHYGGDLKSGPEAKSRDQNPDGPTYLENSRDIAKPLTESDLRELLNHALPTNQFDASSHGESDREKNGQNPGNGFPDDSAYIDFGANVRLLHRLISFRLDNLVAQNTEATTMNRTNAIMHIVIKTNTSIWIGVPDAARIGQDRGREPIQRAGAICSAAPSTAVATFHSPARKNHCRTSETTTSTSNTNAPSDTRASSKIQSISGAN
jgi:hypothetical protein